MCVSILTYPFDLTHQLGPIDPILRASDHGKYHLSPVYDLFAPVFHSCLRRIRRFPGKGQTRRFVYRRGTIDGVLLSA